MLIRANLGGAVLKRLGAAAVLVSLSATTVGLAAPANASTFVTITSPNGVQVPSDATVTVTGYNGSSDGQSIEVDCGGTSTQYPVPSGSFAVPVGSFSGPDSCDIWDANSRDYLASFTVAAPVPVAPDWWHTEGSNIYNSANQQVHLRGADDSQMNIINWSAASPAPDATEMQDLSSWGFNFIRLAITWANLEPSKPTVAPSGAVVHHWNQTYLAGLDSVIALARQSNLRIVLDMHQAGGWSAKFGGDGLPTWLYPQLTACKSGDATCPGVNTAQCEFLTDTAEKGVPIRPQEGVIAAWRMLAKRYKSDPTFVGADMFNEPQGCNLPGQSRRTYHVPKATDNPLDKFYYKTGKNLQAVNPNLLLIYEDDAYEPYISLGAALAGKLDLPNAVYSTHYYPDSWSNGNFAGSCKSVPSPTGQETMESYQQRAAGFDQPLYVGEFDAFRLARNGQRCPLLQSEDAASTDLLDMMAYTRAQSINWSLWRYDRAGTMSYGAGSPKQPLVSDLQTGF